MVQMKAALHRLRSAAKRRPCYGNNSPSKPSPNPNFSSANVILIQAAQELRIHGHLSNLKILRLSAWGCPIQRCRFSSSPSAEGLPFADSASTETILVTFVDKHGVEKPVKVPLGMSMLEAAHQNDIELEGACEGSIACSTCHVIVMDEEYYNKLPEPTDEENDMLDLAFSLTETSRLGCQVLAKPELDGMRLAIPSATRNFAVDGYVPKPH